MTEFLQPGHDQDTPQQVAAETARTDPVRLFLFEPHDRYSEAFIEIIGEAVTVAHFRTLEEALRGIEAAYEQDPKPFDRALVAPGTMDPDVSITPGERIIFVLKHKGMDPAAIALHSSRTHLRLDAELDGVGFLDKGVSYPELLKFLSNPH